MAIPPEWQIELERQEAERNRQAADLLKRIEQGKAAEIAEVEKTKEEAEKSKQEREGGGPAERFYSQSPADVQAKIRDAREHQPEPEKETPKEAERMKLRPEGL